MRSLAEFIKTTLIGGLLIVLPIYLATLLLLKGLKGILGLISPVTNQLPTTVEYRQIVAMLIVLAICFVAGLLARTRPGSLARRVVEERVLSRIPGYEILRGLSRRLAGGSEEGSFAPALVEVEEALAPAFIIEELADGSYTVMVPSVPTPAAGALFILPRERVHPVDVPLSVMFRLFSQFGAGTGALVEALHASRSTPRSSQAD
jgi:uncharacterized membrane protein